MIVFKNYLRVAKTYIKLILINSAIFIAIAIISTTSGTNTDTFEMVDARIAIINHDEDSVFIEGFTKYVEEQADLVTIDEDEESLKDALFFRKVDYIMIIPKGYTNDFMNGREMKIEVLSVPDSTAAMYSKELMNTYLNIANIYLKADISEEVLTKKILEDVSKQATIHMATATGGEQVSSAKQYYNFANYILLAITIVIIAMIMVSFNEEIVKRRNSISPVSYKSINRQLLLGNIVVSAAIWLLFVVVSIFLYPEAMGTIQGILYIVNSAVLMSAVIAIGFLLASITNNREVISGVSNVIGLGSSFIAGAFVPQELLGSFVLFIAKFTPSYWYIKNNNDIAKIMEINASTLQPIFLNMAIIFGFTVILYVAIQVLGRLKLRK